MSRALLAAVAPGLLLGACALHDVKEDREAEVAVPEVFGQAEPASSQGPSPAAGAPDRWWTTFDDASLTTTIDAGLSGNLDLKQAWSRLAQADALGRQSRSGRWPQVEASVQASKSHRIINSGAFGQLEVDDPQYDLSVSAAYEIDVWGRVAHLIEAADADRAAGRLDLSAAAMSLAATTTDLWYALAEVRAQAALLDDQIGTSRRYLELVEQRFAQGLAGALDVRQQRQQLRALEAQVPPLAGREATLRHQLAVLQGRAPSEELPGPAASVPDLGALPATGVPSELLQRRPDVEAARLRVLSADHRIGVALADRFPALRVGGSTGYSATSLSDLLSNWIWSIFSSLAAPLFDGDRRSAEVDRARAQLEERMHGYSKAVLVALQEVEDALALERHQRDHLAALEAQLREASATLEEAKSRYVQGLVDYLPVLSALSGHQQVEQRLLSARRQLLSHRIQLHRALGGSWAAELSAEIADGGTP